MNHPENVPLIRAEFIRRDPDPGKAGKFIAAGFGESMQEAFEDAVMQLSARDGVRMPGENSRKAVHPADEIAARVKADIAEKFEQAFTGPDGTPAESITFPGGGNVADLLREKLKPRTLVVRCDGSWFRVDGEISNDDVVRIARDARNSNSFVIPDGCHVTLISDPDAAIL